MTTNTTVAPVRSSLRNLRVANRRAALPLTARAGTTEGRAEIEGGSIAGSGRTVRSRCLLCASGSQKSPAAHHRLDPFDARRVPNHASRHPVE